MATTPTTTPLEVSAPRLKGPSPDLSFCLGNPRDRFLGRIAASGFLVLVSAYASAQSVRIEPVLDVMFTATDNVDLAPSDQRKSDFVIQLTPYLRVNERGAHTSLSGSIGATVLNYMRDGGSNVEPQVSLLGRAELLERLLFVDGSVQIQPSFFSAFGAQPRNLANTTANRYTSYTYTVSPYLDHVVGDFHYELRDDNVWTSSRGTPVNTQDSYENGLLARMTRDPTPLGWSLEYKRDDTRFVDQPSLVTETSRAHAIWQATALWQISAHVGYEENRYPLFNNSDAIYGVGAKWHPTDRTTVDATWEHRFFGSAYHVAFDHRTALSVWSLRADRDLTTYPQQFASFAAGSDVAASLNRLFLSRFPDPIQRQTVVDQLIRERGLPPILSDAVRLYTQQVTLQESEVATMGLLGARNAVFVSLYRSRTEPLLSSSSITPSDILANSTQTGANAVWSLKLTQLYTFTANADWSRTVGNGELAAAETRQWSLSGTIDAPLSPLTRVFAGARYQRFLSDVASSYREAAAFVGMSHTFR
jgi:uncharacterized protein (PEP-CTERM system associated)